MILMIKVMEWEWLLFVNSDDNGGGGDGGDDDDDESYNEHF